MPERMTIEQLQFFMSRLTLFWSANRVAEELDVTPLTIRYWQRHDHRPSLTRLGDFEDALKQLTKELRRKDRSPQTRFHSAIADLLFADPIPKYYHPATGDTNALNDILISMTLNKQAKSTDIFKATKGYTKMQVYYAADKLGIKRHQKVKGRNGYALWSMK